MKSNLCNIRLFVHPIILAVLGFFSSHAHFEVTFDDLATAAVKLVTQNNEIVDAKQAEAQAKLAAFTLGNKSSLFPKLGNNSLKSQKQRSAFFGSAPKFSTFYADIPSTNCFQGTRVDKNDLQVQPQKAAGLRWMNRILRDQVVAVEQKLEEEYKKLDVQYPGTPIKRDEWKNTIEFIDGNEEVYRALQERLFSLNALQEAISIYASLPVLPCTTPATPNAQVRKPLEAIYDEFGTTHVNAALVGKQTADENAGTVTPAKKGPVTQMQLAEKQQDRRAQHNVGTPSQLTGAVVATQDENSCEPSALSALCALRLLSASLQESPIPKQKKHAPLSPRTPAVNIPGMVKRRDENLNAPVKGEQPFRPSSSPLHTPSTAARIAAQPFNDARINLLRA